MIKRKILFELQLVSVIESMHEKIGDTLLAKRKLYYLAINYLATKSTCRQEDNIPIHNSRFHASYI